jgi:predicted metalloprotease
MRWRGRRQSSNVEDRRGRSMIRSKRGARGGVAVLLILAGIFFGQDVQKILSLFVGTQNQQAQQQPASQTTQASNDEAAQFVRTILAETEDT